MENFNKLKIYKNEKYPQLIGKETSIGICTVWNDPKRVFNEIHEVAGIVGTLYSKYGVNLILRNLALNPQINTLYLWANGSLSNTEIGKKGWSFLKQLWENTDLKNIELEEGIDKKIVKTIIENVKLVDISELEHNEIKKYILKNNRLSKKEYMKPVNFTEPTQKPVETFPSEKIGFTVRDKTIFSTWARAVDKIMRYGDVLESQYGYKQKQVINLNWIIQNENVNKIDFSKVEELPTDVKDIIGFNKNSLNEYYKEVFLKSEESKNSAYTYGNRLRKFKTGNNSFVDQLETSLIGNLQKSPDSRRAVAVTYKVETDSISSEPPCLMQIQTLRENRRLHLLATFRSHDIFKAGISNAYGLLKIQEEICNKLKMDKGYLLITSQSAHIYEQDFDNAEKLCKCLFWDREPNMFWDNTQLADERGSFLVNIVGKNIEIILQDSEGHYLFTLQGPNAKYLSLKLSQLDLFGRYDHAMDIARELQKAEIALQKNLKYIQDQPLIL